MKKKIKKPVTKKAESKKTVLTLDQLYKKYYTAETVKDKMNYYKKIQKRLY
jgi:hypothetical protein